ncbi:MAG: hypothetical protein ACYDEZ_10030 [Methanoregula sp.]
MILPLPDGGRSNGYIIQREYKYTAFHPGSDYRRVLACHSSGKFIVASARIH